MNYESRVLFKSSISSDSNESSILSSSILLTACITVVWSLPPKVLPISGKDFEVSCLDKYIAICLGLATALALLGEDISLSLMLKYSAEYFNIRLSDMSSPRRARAVARPRQIAMYLSKQLTSKSLPEIGRTFGGRDHTTVMHAVSRIDELSIEDSLLSDDIELLKRTLDS